MYDVTTYDVGDLNLDTSGLVAGTKANAADVKTPLDEAEAAIEQARGTVSATENSTKYGHLYDTLESGDAIAIDVQNASAAETVRIAVQATGITADYVLGADGDGTVSWKNPSILGVAEGAIDIGVTAGETLAQRDLVFIDPSDNQAYKVDRESDVGLLMGFVTDSGGISSSSTGTIRVFGEVTGFSGLNDGQEYFAGSTDGGIGVVEPDPSSGGSQVARIFAGYAISATSLLAMPKLICYLMRDSLANGESFTIAFKNAVHKDAYTQIVEAYSGDIVTGGTASASAGSEADNVFDGSPHTSGAISSATGWFKYDFGASNEQTVTQYAITPFYQLITRSPSDWTFQGSNNDADWTTLDTQSSFTLTDWNERRVFQFSNATAYRYYRLNITGVLSGSTIELNLVEMMEDATEYIRAPEHTEKVRVRHDNGSGGSDTLNVTFINMSPNTVDVIGVVEINT